MVNSSAIIQAERINLLVRRKRSAVGRGIERLTPCFHNGAKITTGKARVQQHPSIQQQLGRRSRHSVAALDLRKHERREKWDLARGGGGGGGGRVGKGHQVHVRRLRPSVGEIAENGHARPHPQIVIADIGVMDLAGISQCRRRLVDGVEILQPADIARRTGGIRSREKGFLREAATVGSVQDVEPGRRWRRVAYLAMAGDECPPHRDGLCRRNWGPRTLDLEILLLPKRNSSIEVHPQATSSVLSPQSSPRASDPIATSHAAADLTPSLPSPLQVMPSD
ncbi:hypothetical protein BHM03_00013165 [Ensete ventricosum]|nr:hypothetical protein BHM03_00013165 [Ensete ventricosum]